MANHLTFQEREVLYRMKKAGKSKAEIAATLGRHRSTIYRTFVASCLPGSDFGNSNTANSNTATPQTNYR